MRLFLLFSISFLLFFSLNTNAQSRLQKLEKFKRLGRKINSTRNYSEKLQAQFQDLQNEILSPTEKDKEIAKDLGADAVRLFPDFVLDKFIVAGEGYSPSVYTFTHQQGSFYFAPRIGFMKGNIQFNRYAEYSELGFIRDLGNFGIEKVDDKNPTFIELASFQPPIEQPKANFIFGDFKRFSKAIVEHTYLLRTISYENTDLIAAIKIHRKDVDGSIILFVKVLKTFEPPKVARKETPRQSPTPPNPEEALKKVNKVLLKKGFRNVIIDYTTVPWTIRGTVPKGKMAEAVKTVQESLGKPVKNELTEQ
ncbi:MAG TPA: hypothetical protein PKY82_09925 [Pyrinomonadaceae bacterium]|nr:hypothetical protein [Pyrinomonadaceae bacterium]